MGKTDERNVGLAKEALNRVIKEAGRCENDEELNKIAAKIFEEELGDHPALIKRACEAFNSNKSVYKLANSSDEVRGENFALLNADEILNKIASNRGQKALKKAANLHPKFYANPIQKPVVKQSIKKAASAFNPAAEIELDNRPTLGDVTIMNVLKHQQDMMYKLAFAEEQANGAKVDALEKVVRVANNMSKQAKAEVGGICSAYYGALFDGLKDVFAKDNSLKKFASTPALPKGGIYELIDNYVGRSYLADNYRALCKTASEDIAKTLRKFAGAYNLRRIRKAAALPAGMGTPLQSLISGTAMGEALGFRNTEEDQVERELLNENVKNILRELEMKRNFYEVYADDYISTFPLYQVQDAYNDAIQKLPERLRKNPSAATQLIRSWVTKQLSHGGVPSAEDAADIMEAAKSFRKDDEVYA